MLSSAPATPASAVGVSKGLMMMCWRPCWGGLPTPIAHSGPRPSDAATVFSRACDALSGHKESAGVLVDDRARVVVGDVPHETLGAFETPARALDATRAATRDLHDRHARACKDITVRDPDKRGGPRIRRRGRQLQDAAMGGCRQARELSLNHDRSQARLQEEADR